MTVTRQTDYPYVTSWNPQDSYTLELPGTSEVDDLLLVVGYADSEADPSMSLTGGGVTTWTVEIAQAVTGAALYLAWGVVTTAGATSVVITAKGGMYFDAGADCLTGETGWEFVSSAYKAENSSVNPSPGPTLTATAVGQALWAWVFTEESPTSVSPSSFSLVTDSNYGTPFVLNPSAASATSYTPEVTTTSAGTSDSVGGVFSYSDAPDPSTGGYLGWLAVLNQLAGTSNLGENAAANAYAGTENLGLLAALNAKAETTGLGLNAVCNVIAGTSGLEAVNALNVKAGNGPS